MRGQLATKQMMLNLLQDKLNMDGFNLFMESSKISIIKNCHKILSKKTPMTLRQSIGGMSGM